MYIYTKFQCSYYTQNSGFMHSTVSKQNYFNNSRISNTSKFNYIPIENFIGNFTP